MKELIFGSWVALSGLVGIYVFVQVHLRTGWVIAAWIIQTLAMAAMIAIGVLLFAGGG